MATDEKNKLPPKLPPMIKEKGGKGKRDKKGKKARGQRMSIASLLILASLLSILMGGTVAGGYALYIVYKNKLIDTWAILFLELESQGHRIIQQMESYYFPGRAPDKDNPKPDVVLEVVDTANLKKVMGDFPDQIKPAELSVASAKLENKWNVLQFSGDQYLAVAASQIGASRATGTDLNPGNYILMWKVDLHQWLRDSVKDATKNTLYVVSKQGRLLFSNEPRISQTNYVQRPLVQRFVSIPMNQGQLEFDGEDGAAYGFFYEVPLSNIVIFVETLKSVALASVRELALHFSIVLLFIMGAVGILLQFPLSSLIAPMKELVRLAADIGDGNFNIRPKQEGFGELKILSRSFGEMAKNLMVRDERISLLLVEQQEKLRLVNELTIAQSIQNNFLFKGKLPFECGLEVAAQYTPAEEVAGDWYGYFFNEAAGETIFAIADVSGHGAGSAMFTAIIAATFEETRARSVGLATFPMEDFVRRLNRLVMKLGHGNIHATLLMAKYKKGSEKIELINAGHTFPLILPPKESGKAPEPVLMRSDLLGMSLDFFPVVKTLDFPKNTSILMYTDGLTEGSPDNRLYRDKRLANVAHIESHHTVKQIVDNVYEDWRAFLKGQPARDDLCLLVARVAA